MKKYFLAIPVFMLLAFCLFSCDLMEEDLGYTPSEGLAFTSNGDGTCYVSGIGDCTDVDVFVPSKSPEGDTVTSIGNPALDSGVIIDWGEEMDPETVFPFYKNQTLRSVTLPNTVKTIGLAAFGGCEKLESVSIPDSVTNIGIGAFAYCKKLKDISIPFRIA